MLATILEILVSSGIGVVTAVVLFVVGHKLSRRRDQKIDSRVDTLQGDMRQIRSSLHVSASIAEEKQLVEQLAELDKDISQACYKLQHRGSATKNDIDAASEWRKHVFEIRKLLEAYKSGTATLDELKSELERHRKAYRELNEYKEGKA